MTSGCSTPWQRGRVPRNRRARLPDDRAEGGRLARTSSCSSGFRRGAHGSKRCLVDSLPYPVPDPTIPRSLASIAAIGTLLANLCSGIRALRADGNRVSSIPDRPSSSPVGRRLGHSFDSPHRRTNLAGSQDLLDSLGVAREHPCRNNSSGTVPSPAHARSVSAGRRTRCKTPHRPLAGTGRWLWAP